MKIKTSTTCTFCQYSGETEHLFIKCPYALALWLDVEAFLSFACNRDIQFSDADKLLGSLQEDAFINYIILLVKKHIYYHKCKESIPNYEDF